MEIQGFENLVEIGRGGFGSVYRADDVNHGRPVAIKILPLSDEGARRRFARERRAMGSVSNHPSIATVLTSGLTEQGDAFIAMELVTGGSLANRMKAGRFDTAAVLRIGREMAGALEAAHAAGVLHLDIKPENVLLTEYDELRLVDFGIAAIQGDPTATTSVFGTPAYSAPEFLGGETPTAAADVYGVGATLYALLMGSPPYVAGDEATALGVIRNVALAPVPVVDRDDVPLPLRELLAQSMAKRPEQRPQSIAEFMGLLEAAAAQIDTQPMGAEETRVLHADVLAASLPPDTPLMSVEPATPIPAAQTDSSPRSIPGWMYGAVAAVILIAVVVAVLASSNEPDTEVATVETPEPPVEPSAVPAPPTAVPDPTATPAPPPPTPTVVVEQVVDLIPATDFLGLRLPAVIELVESEQLFTMSWPDFCGNVVSEQDPAAGELIAPGTNIDIELIPCVPDLVGLRLPAAIELANESPDFSITWPDHCDDLVTSQVPGGNTPAAVEADIEANPAPIGPILIELQLVAC